MQLRLIAVAAAAAASLSGCVEQSYSPAPIDALTQACIDGNQGACNAAAAQAANRPAPQPFPMVHIPYQDPAPFMRQRPSQTQTVCRNNFGQVVCQSY